MDLLKTGIGIKQTIRNVGRAREILSVFAKNGFSELIQQAQFSSVVPGFVIPRKFRTKLLTKPDENVWETVGRRLRVSFEELGPSFIKFGQLLATREDQFDAAFICEMKKLQSKVPPIDFASCVELIQESLGNKSLDEVYESISEEALAAASIGSVFKAKLKASGEDVVIKVQRPGVRDQIETDFQIVQFVVERLERVSEEIQFLGLSRLIDDFSRSVLKELNFVYERQNLNKIKSYIETVDQEKITKIPRAYQEYSNEKVLVLEFLDGVPFSEVSSDALTPELQKKLEDSVKLFIQILLKHGFFHADLHGGNFLLLKDQNIGIIDFGSVGLLSHRGRHSLLTILYALLNFDYENLVYEFLNIAEFQNIPDHRELTRKFQEDLSPFIGLSAQDINVSDLFHAITRILSEFKVYLPREWFLIFRTLMNLDGVGKNLEINLNVFDLLNDDVNELFTEVMSLDRLKQESLWFSRDMVNSARSFPRHLTWFLMSLSKENYAFKVKQVEVSKSIDFLSRGLSNIGICLFSLCFFITGFFVLPDKNLQSFAEIPNFTSTLWGVSFLLALIFLIRIR